MTAPTADQVLNQSMRTMRCRSCQAPIIWLKTAAGKNMPCDAPTVAHDDQAFDRAKGHTSHFATCPQAKYHRRAR